MKNIPAFNDDFSHLSLKDLLEARELYHIHLMHKKNVVATAVGKYRIRKDDPYPNETPRLQDKSTALKKVQRPPRTLENSEVRYYSWPCILVFVEKWEDEKSLMTIGYNEIVPKVLYLPDGRKIPVCTVVADKTDTYIPSNSESKFPDNLIGGGYPVISTVQGKTHIASIGCLLTDGHKTYALTNHHVAGDENEVLSTILRGKQTVIGKSSPNFLRRTPFEEVYPDFKGRDIYVNMDIGLIEIDDLNYWTAQVYGIGQLGLIADLSSENMTLNLIGMHVKAFGCASGEMKGQIEALFYRYKSIGGFEYVSDFLIAQRSDSKKKTRGSDNLFTRHGDSGTLWVTDSDDEDPQYRNQPVAIQWGGHVFSGTNSKSAYALATCLSTVCNLLDLDVERGWNIGHDQYWGAVGHYSIANAAISLLKDAKLKKLMGDNLDRITFETAEIEQKKLAGMSKWDFVPMADVPDMVWKIRGGENQRTYENPNHFADMDKKDSNGKTLLDLMKKASDINTKSWMKYYQDPKVKDSTMGCLPFRTWQIFDDMIDYVKKGETAKFIAAAGIVSHYVGDACQPLHISYMFNGIPDGKNTTGKGVHAAYEDGMVNRYIDDLRPQIDAKAKGKTILKNIPGGRDAAFKLVGLMKGTFASIKPKSIVDEFVSVENESGPDISQHLFEKFGAATVDIMAEGSAMLASFWESAWAAGKGGKNMSVNGNGAVDKKDLIKLYQDKDFLKSMRLKDFDADGNYS